MTSGRAAYITDSQENINGLSLCSTCFNAQAHLPINIYAIEFANVLVTGHAKIQSASSPGFIC